MNENNQKDPNDRVQNDSNYIFPELCSICLGLVDVLRNFAGYNVNKSKHDTNPVF